MHEKCLKSEKCLDSSPFLARSRRVFPRLAISCFVVRCLLLLPFRTKPPQKLPPVDSMLAVEESEARQLWPSVLRNPVLTTAPECIRQCLRADLLRRRAWCATVAEGQITMRRAVSLDPSLLMRCIAL